MPKFYAGVTDTNWFLYLKEQFKWNYLVGFCFIILAQNVTFTFIASEALKTLKE